jgi:hypothetical protein
VTERQRLGAKLDPALREWADRVIILALAREYQADCERVRIAESVEPVAQSQAKMLPSDQGDLVSLRCAIYSRFSSDRQSPISVEDQIRKCREGCASGLGDPR